MCHLKFDIILHPACTRYYNHTSVLGWRVPKKPSNISRDRPKEDTKRKNEREKTEKQFHILNIPSKLTTRQIFMKFFKRKVELEGFYIESRCGNFYLNFKSDFCFIKKKVMVCVLLILVFDIM